MHNMRIDMQQNYATYINHVRLYCAGCKKVITPLAIVYNECPSADHPYTVKIKFVCMDCKTEKLYPVSKPEIADIQTSRQLVLGVINAE